MREPFCLEQFCLKWPNICSNLLFDSLILLVSDPWKNHPRKFSTKRREKKNTLDLLDSTLDPTGGGSWPFLRAPECVVVAWRFEYCVLLIYAVHPKKGLGHSFDICHKKTTCGWKMSKNISLKLLEMGDLHHPRTYDNRKETITPNTKAKSKQRWVSVSPLYPPTGGLSNRFLLHPMPTWDLLHPASQTTCTNLWDRKVGRYGFTTCGMKYPVIPWLSLNPWDTVDGRNPKQPPEMVLNSVNNGINYPSTGAGFVASTVVQVSRYFTKSLKINPKHPSIIPNVRSGVTLEFQALPQKYLLKMCLDV